MYKIINGIKIDEYGNLDDTHAENYYYVSSFINNFLIDEGDRFEDHERILLHAAKIFLESNVHDYIEKCYIQEKEC